MKSTHLSNAEFSRFSNSKAARKATRHMKRQQHRNERHEGRRVIQEEIDGFTNTGSMFSMHVREPRLVGATNIAA